MSSQLFVNGLVAGAGYSTVALSLGLMCNTSGFLNFSFAGIYTFAAYIVISASKLGLPIGLAIVIGVLAAATGAAALEAGLFRQLRKQGAAPEILLLASFGALIVLQNAVSLLWGDRTVGFESAGSVKTFEVLGARITSIQAMMITYCFALALLLMAGLGWTKLGRKFRAVACNRRLAYVGGMRVEALIAAATGIAAGLAAVSAVLRGFDTDLTPSMGFHSMLMGLVALMLGDMKSVTAVLLAGFGLGLVQQIVAWYLPGQWQESVAMVILLLFVWLRPPVWVNSSGSRGVA